MTPSGSTGRPRRPDEQSPTDLSSVGFIPSSAQKIAFLQLGGRSPSSYELSGIDGPVPADVPDPDGCGLRFTDAVGRDVVVIPGGGRFVLGREEGPYWAVKPPGFS